MVFDCGYASYGGNIRIGNGGTVGTVHWQIVEGVEKYKAVSTAGFIAENQWYHIVGTVAGSSGSATMVLYIDGVAVDNRDERQGAHSMVEMRTFSDRIAISESH